MNNQTGAREHSPLRVQVFTSEFIEHALKEFHAFIDASEYGLENAVIRQTSEAIDILEGRVVMTADHAQKVMFALDWVEANTLTLDGNLREHQKKTIEVFDSFGRCECTAYTGGMHGLHIRRAKRYLKLYTQSLLDSRRDLRDAYQRGVITSDEWKRGRLAIVEKAEALGLTDDILALTV